LPMADMPLYKSHRELAQHLVKIPHNVTDRDNRLIGYYQWVPVVLLLQALLFVLPIVFWRSMYEGVCIKVQAICSTAAVADNMVQATRSKNMALVGRFLTARVWSTVEGGWLHEQLKGRYVLALYLLTKLLFVVNSLLQFFALKSFLGIKGFGWGWNLLFEDWHVSGNFPRVTLCDFEIRELGNLHRHTIQCVLIVNMFNEKIYNILYCWFLIVALVSTASFLYWLATSLVSRKARQIIISYLHKVDPQSANNARRKFLVQQFLDESLKADGVFLLRLIGQNGGDAVACELVDLTWNDFKRKHAMQPRAGSTPPGSRRSRTPASLSGRSALIDYSS